MAMTQCDRDALRRALVAARSRNEARKKQIDSMLCDRDWETVAEFASYSVQRDALRLKPWQFAPCEVDIGDIDAPGYEHRGAAPAAELLQQLLAAGLSRWEPDPVTALDEVADRRE
jgi:hypothetical protein